MDTRIPLEIMPESTVTAGSYGPSEDASPSHGASFEVPYLTVDAKGRVTQAFTKHITLPNLSDTDTKVTQTVSTDNIELPVLAKATNGTSTVTDTSKFSANIKLNPSTGTVTATTFKGSLDGVATKAAADASGNNIAETYATKTESEGKADADHVHGNISNDGKVGTTSGLPLITTTGGKVTTGSFGTAAGTFVQGNDSRLSDARTPKSHTHGNIQNDGTLGSTASLAVVTDGNKKVTVSSTTAAEIGYVHGVTSSIQTQLNGKAASSHEHAASDITSGTLSVDSIPSLPASKIDSGTLDAARIPNIDASKITSGTIDIARLPAGALERCVVVEGEAGRFALTSNDVQTGDTVKQVNNDGTATMYFVVDDTHLDSEAGYEVYTAGSATSVPWSGITDKPSSFTPAAHATSATTYGVSSASNYGHAMATSTTPKAAGTAAVGSETAKFARGDHVHPAQTSVSGNAGSATEFASAQTVALTGDVTGSASSKAGWTVATTLSDSGVTADSYGPSADASPAHSGTFTVPQITVDSKGRVTSASNKTITLPSDQNTDTLVTQNVSTANENHPILLTVTKDASANQGAKTAIFAAGVKVNPSTGTVTATTFSGAVTGNASSATEFSSAKSVTLTGDVTGTASSKAGWSVATTLSNSGVTANSYGPSSDASPAHSGTFKVPYITVDAKGRVTAAADKTITLPASGNTDTKVTQTVTTTSGEYPILAKNTTATATITDTSRFASAVTLNPSTGTITATKFKGATEGNADTATKAKGVFLVIPNETTQTATLTATVEGITEYFPGLTIALRMPFASAASSTLNINSLGAKPIYYNNNTDGANYYPANSVVILVYETTTASTGCWKMAYSYDSNTNNATAQNISTSNNTYPILIGYTANATANIGNKATYFCKDVKINPSTGIVSANGFSGPISGNADTATKFASNQTVALTGDVTGSASSQAGWSVATTLSNSGVTADTYGNTSQQTPSHGGTFNVPYVTVDAKGRVTAAGTSTVKLPSDQNTDTKVTQTVSTDNAELPLLAKDSNGTSTVTASSKFAAAVKLNPSTGTVTATKFVGDGSGLTALNGSQVTTGTVAAARIASLDASKIDSGTFDAARIPSLDASKINSGTIDIARLPAGALEKMVVVDDQAARFALTTAQVQNGDTVKQVSPNNTMYYVVDDTKLNSEDGYEIYTAGSATSVPWSGVTGKPSTFPPSSHTHASNDVTAMTGYSKPSSTSAIGTSDTLNSAVGKLEKALDGKAPTSHASTATTYGVSSASNYGHAMASSTTPIVAGTATLGDEVSKFARGDHVHPAQTSVSGNAGTATKLATARTIDGVDFNGTAAISHYGSCSTAAATAEKAVSVTSYKLVTGSWVAVKFTVTNTAANPTLNVNSTGAKAIYYRGAAVSAGYLAANRTYLFVYNGTQYDLIGDLDTNTTYSAGTGLSLSSNQFSLSDSGITAGTIGETSQQTPSHGGTFNIPYVTVDAKGRLTAGGTTTVKLPSDQNTDTKVTQTVSTDNAELPILAKASNATSTVTDTSKFAAAVKINPSTGNLTATKFTGDGTGINIGDTANLPLITTTDGKITAGSFGTAANTFCQGNDSRLSDSRTPKSHTHGNITNAGAIGSTANLPVITTTSGVLTTGSFGTGANTFCQGNDSRLSNARTPTAHASTATTYGVSSDTNYGHAMASSTTPIVAGTAAVGSETAKFARGDHVHPEQTLVNKTRGVFLVIPTQTSQTATLTATVDGITEYFDGLTIAYRAPFNTAASSTLNINSLGAKPIYYKVNTTSKDYYPANSVILLVYETTTVSTGCWKMVYSYDGNTNYYERRLHSNAIKAAAAVTSGTIMVGTSAGYKQVASGITFDLQYPILYASAAIAANATATNTYEVYPGINLQTTKASWTGTQYSTVFLVGTISGTTVTIDSGVFTTTVPSSADGKVYIPLGVLYSTYQLYFAPTKDVYHYTNGSFHLYDATTVASGTESLSWNTSVTLATVNGTAIKAKLPANPDTDSKVAVTLGTTTKAYLLGTSTTPTSTAQGVTSIADTGVYLDTTAGNLTATKFNGDGTGLNIGSTANLPLITTTNGKITTGSFGTAANTFCQGNDSRLSNARTPTAHASTATTYGVSDASNYGHAMASSTTPKAAGTAAVGSETAKFARGDHVHPAQTTVSGNAGSATKLATARTIDGVSFDGSAAIVHYGSCSTAAGTAAKTVACTSYSLDTGSWVAVKFTVTNTAANPTLNVNSTGAKAIYYRGSAISAGNLAANRTYLFVYNGTQYDLIGDLDTNTTYSAGTGLSLSSSQFSLSDSGVTAGTIGNTSQQTPSHGGTFNIPYVTVDAKGRVTAGGTTTVKLPTDQNTDTKVNVTLGTTTKAYLLGTSTTPTSTAQAVTSISDTGVYLDTTAGRLTATSFAGDVTNGTLGTASRAVVTDANKKLTVSSVTSTELGYLSGVTSAIQTQLNSKATDSGLVHITGTETITGAKTFSNYVSISNENIAAIRFKDTRIHTGIPLSDSIYQGMYWYNAEDKASASIYKRYNPSTDSYSLVFNSYAPDNSENNTQLALTYPSSSNLTTASFYIGPEVKLNNVKVRRTSDSSRMLLCGGSDSDFGATIALYGKDHSSYPGWASIHAKDGTNDRRLVCKSSGYLTWTGYQYQLLCEHLEKNVVPQTLEYAGYTIRDVNNVCLGCFQYAQRPSGAVDVKIGVYPDETVDDDFGAIYIGFDSNGVAYGRAPSTPETRSDGRDIITRNWIPKDTRIVHTTGAETISGVKTFTSKIDINTTALDTVHFNYGSTMLVPSALPTDTLYRGYSVRDGAGRTLVDCYHRINTTGHAKVWQMHNLSATDATQQFAFTYNNSTNKFYLSGPAQFDADDDSTKIPNTAWIRDATGNFACNAATATKLATARSLKTKLDSTTAVTFDGSANQNAIPVTGTLGIANGGTGSSTKNFVDLTTDQEISGIKTHKNHIVISENSSVMTLQMTNLDTTVSTTTNKIHSAIAFNDKNDIAIKNRTAAIQSGMQADDSNYIALIAYDPTANSTNYHGLSVRYPRGGTPYTACITPSSASDDSNKIATTEWVRDATGNFACNAATATKLKTAMTINGVSFDGSANITVADSTKLPLAGGTMTGTIVYTKTATVNNESQTSTYNVGFGGGTSLNFGFWNVVKGRWDLCVNNDGTGYLRGKSTSTEKFETARTIAISGGATGTATSFDGSANITIPVTALDVSKASAGTLPVARGGTGLTSLDTFVRTTGAQSIAGVKTFTDRLDIAQESISALRFRDSRVNTSATISTTTYQGMYWLNADGDITASIYRRTDKDDKSTALSFNAYAPDNTSVNAYMSLQQPLSTSGVGGYLYLDADVVINKTEIRKHSSNSSLSIMGGTDKTNNPYLQLNGKDASANKGVFSLWARDGTNNANLIGKPDGTLTWAGENLYNLVHRSGNETIAGSKTFTALPIIDRTGSTLAAGALAHVLVCKYKNSADNVDFTTYPISVIGNDATNANNVGVRLGSINGTTIVTAGESSVTFASTVGKYNDENLYLTADNEIQMYVKCANNSTSYAGPIVFSGTAASEGTNSTTTITATTFNGNATSATKLATARTINGVSFNGTANITVADSTKLPLSGGTMTGNITWSETATISGASKTHNAQLTMNGDSLNFGAYDNTYSKWIWYITPSGDASFEGNASTATTLSSTLAVNKGGTGATTLDGAGIVTKTGDQTIGGQKTFSSTPIISRVNPYLHFIETDWAKGDTTGSTSYQGIVFKDKNNTDAGNVLFHYYPSSQTAGVKITAYNLTTASATGSGSVFMAYKTGGVISFSPESSGTILLGRSDVKWKEVWCTQSSLNSTSDERLKNSIDQIPENVLDAWEDVNWVQFKYNDATKEKGTENARIHSGVVAQQIKQVFDDANIDVNKYGFFLHDEWEAEEAEYDENGNITTPAKEAGDQYGLRYTEALCIEAAYQRRRAERAEKRIEMLEERLANIEIKMNM